MVPRVAKRGYSFKGAGAYYLHDKNAQTSERVGWTQTHNLPTQDAEKAMKIMAFTAMNSERIKIANGSKTTGKKPTTGTVYSYSLAWTPDQQPSKEEMIKSATHTLNLLNLSDHQAVFVCHQETDHPHIHILANLVNPNTGLRAKLPKKDFIALSQWAEEKEKLDGKIYCDQRVINNKIRRGVNPSKDDLEQRALRKKQRQQRKDLVQSLYAHSDSGQAFAAALQLNDYTLAKGDRRGFVLVDKNGEIYSVSRLLKETKNSELKKRLSGVKDLPLAKELSEKRKYFDKVQYEIDWQKDLENNAHLAAKQKDVKEENPKISPIRPKPQEIDELLKAEVLKSYERQKSLLLLEFDQHVNNKLALAERKYEQTENLELSKSNLKDLEKKLNETKGIFAQKRRRQLEEQINLTKAFLAQTQQRVQEQLDSLKQKIEAEKKEYLTKLDDFDIDQRVRDIQNWRDEELKKMKDSKTDKDKGAPSQDLEIG